MSFWPRKIDIQDIWVSSIWALIAGFLWSLLILAITFFSSWALNISDTFANAKIWAVDTSSIFPLILSLITFFGTGLTMYITYFILNMISPERYKKNLVILWQISFFWILTYAFFTPAYIYLWIKSYEYIMYIFILHTLVVTFWTSIILEVMNNYRHILIWIYWSFIWLFFASGLSIMIFFSFSGWTAKLFSLVVLLPIINFTITFFKQIFELIYYKYHLATNQDQLWDIFYQIEMDEKEALRLEEEKNLI